MESKSTIGAGAAVGTKGPVAGAGLDAHECVANIAGQIDRVDNDTLTREELASKVAVVEAAVGGYEWWS